MKQLLDFVEHLQGITLPTLPDGLKSQVLTYMRAVVELEKKRGLDTEDSMEQRKLAMLYFKLWQFVYSREERATDSLCPEIKMVEQIERKFFPLGTPRLVLCVDGRVLSKLFAGLHEGAFRTPAGDNAEFVPYRDRDGIFLNRGTLSALLDKNLTERNTLVEVLDSHLHCAARKASEVERTGKEPADGGLYRDVLRKKGIGDALVRYVRSRYGDEKQLLVIQTSFDPLGGYCFMGLEKEECLIHPAVIQEGFTDEALQTLVAEGKIISTREFVENGSMLRDTFSEHHFVVNYETEYRESTRLFWEHIDAMAETCLPFIEEALMNVFPSLEKQEAYDERRERATLLLANAYNAFLHNFDAQGQPKEYPYREHDESVVTVTYGDRGPYDRARSFSVDPNNPDLSYVVRFTAGLIRANRRAKRYSLTEAEALQACYGEKRDEYPQNPVPAFFFERLETLPDAGIVEALQQIDWSDVAALDWMNMTSSAFEDYLNEKVPNIPAVVARRIDSLRVRAAELFRPGYAATEDILDGRLVPVWTLSGPDRRTVALFPFLAKGYEDLSRKQ